MSSESDYTKLEIHSILSQYMDDGKATDCLIKISLVMNDENNASSLVRLMQKWLAET